MKLGAKLAWLYLGVVTLFGVTSRIESAAAESKEASNPTEVSGKITAIDSVGGTLMLERGTGDGNLHPMAFQVNEETLISKGGMRLTPADLRAGDERVTIQYVTQEGKPVARTISIESPGDLKRVSGKLEVVDLAKGQLTVKPTEALFGGQPITLNIDEATLVSRSGQRTVLANMRAGDEVAVQYAVHNDKRVARLIEVLSQVSKPWSAPRGQSSEPQRQAPGAPGYSPSRQ